MTKDEIIYRLSTDPIFGILTRPALELEILKKRKPFNCIFLDIKDLKFLNERYGYELVNDTIRYIFKRCYQNFEDRNIQVTVSRWFSGDEIVVLCNRLNIVEIEKIQRIISENFFIHSPQFIDMHVYYRHEYLLDVKNLSDLKQRIKVLK